MQPHGYHVQKCQFHKCLLKADLHMEREEVSEEPSLGNQWRLAAEGFLGCFTAFSAPWVSGQPSERLSVILINKPMNWYLLGDFEAAAVDSLLAGSWRWGHFPWTHRPSPWVWNCRSGWCSLQSPWAQGDFHHTVPSVIPRSRSPLPFPLASILTPAAATHMHCLVYPSHH